VSNSAFSDQTQNSHKIVIDAYREAQKTFNETTEKVLAENFARQDLISTVIRSTFATVCVDTIALEMLAVMEENGKFSDIPLIYREVSTYISDMLQGKKKMDVTGGIYLFAFYWLAERLMNSDIDWSFGEGDRFNLSYELLPLLNKNEKAE
jgi:hypothetical protein